MDIVFLGYMDLNFDANDGSHIDGIKFYYYFPASSNNYSGYEVGSIFVSRSRSDLCKQVISIKPLSPCILDMGFNGRKSFFNGITTI